MLAHRPQSPGSQHQQGRPALAQEQLRGGQEAAGEQKQQRSSWASDVICRLSLRRPEGVAVDACAHQAFAWGAGCALDGG